MEWGHPKKSSVETKKSKSWNDNSADKIDADYCGISTADNTTCWSAGKLKPKHIKDRLYRLTDNFRISSCFDHGYRKEFVFVYVVPNVEKVHNLCNIKWIIYNTDCKHNQMETGLGLYVPPPNTLTQLQNKVWNFIFLEN